MESNNIGIIEKIAIEPKAIEVKREFRADIRATYNEITQQIIEEVREAIYNKGDNFKPSEIRDIVSRQFILKGLLDSTKDQLIDQITVELLTIAEVTNQAAYKFAKGRITRKTYHKVPLEEEKYSGVTLESIARGMPYKDKDIQESFEKLVKA